MSLGSNTFGKMLTSLLKITTANGNDLVLIQKDTDGDTFTRMMTIDDFSKLIDGASSDTIREITSSTTQNIKDDYISADSGNPAAGINFSLIPASTGVKVIIITAEIDGGNVTIIPAGLDTITGSLVLTPNSSITLAPITGGWSRS